MEKQYIIYAIIALVVIIALIILIMINNSRKEKLKKEVEALYVRFNAVKTVPLAFKLTKAQAMAKRNEQMSKSVQEYYEKFEETEKQIGEIQELIDSMDDAVNTKKHKAALEAVKAAETAIRSAEVRVKEIDVFLDEFSLKENEQREFASKLKEDYRVVKETINANSKVLSIAYNGFMEKLKDCEELFASSEEWMYANDYSKAQEELEQIDEMLEAIKVSANAVPKLIKDTRGVLPIMLDEAYREYSLTKQRCINIDHLDVETKLKEIESNPEKKQEIQALLYDISHIQPDKNLNIKASGFIINDDGSLGGWSITTSGEKNQSPINRKSKKNLIEQILDDKKTKKKTNPLKQAQEKLLEKSKLEAKEKMSEKEGKAATVEISAEAKQALEASKQRNKDKK